LNEGDKKPTPNLKVIDVSFRFGVGSEIVPQLQETFSKMLVARLEPAGF
jgi:hypothetical protein